MIERVLPPTVASFLGLRTVMLARVVAKQFLLAADLV
jgi:hypothetical protein